MTVKDLVATPLSYLDKALGKLRDLGLMPEKPDEMPVIALINQISDLDEEKAIAIARTLNHTTVFNEIVREQIVSMNVGERYEDITNAFDSIRDDAQSMVTQLDDGKIDTLERIRNLWMKVTRGDITSRFRKIKGSYMDVAADTKDQIERENVILEAYRDFRGAIKEAQVLALQLLKKGEAELEAAKGRLDAASKALEASAGGEAEIVAKLELARDEALRGFRMRTSATKLPRTLPRTCRSATTPLRSSWPDCSSPPTSKSESTPSPFPSSAPTKPCSPPSTPPSPASRVYTRAPAL